MPTYVFTCFQEDGGCNHTFEIKAGLHEASNLKPACPKCKKKKPISRNWQAENVAGIESQKTVGSLADKNNKKYSDDYRTKLAYDNTEYMRQDYTGPLPEGASLYEKDKNGKRIPTKDTTPSGSGNKRRNNARASRRKNVGKTG